MKINPLVGIAIGFCIPALSQPVVYRDDTTLISGVWTAPNTAQESVLLTEVIGESPFEGERHYRLSYTVQHGRAGCGLNMDNWGLSAARDFSGYTHLRLAYRGLSAGQQLVVRLRDSYEFGPEVIVGNPVNAYTTVEVSLLALTADGRVKPNAVREINLYVIGQAPQGTGVVYFDAIELVNLNNGESDAAPASALTWARAKRLGAGVNASNWLEAFWRLPTGGYPDVHLYTRSRVWALRQAGFRTFRLPVIFERLAEPNPPYSLYIGSPAFALIDSMIAWAAEMEFHLILDNHHGLPLTDDNYRSQIPRLQAIWTQLAQRYGHLDPERYFFELYNEPTNEILPNHWREVAQAVVAVIRQKEKHRHSIFVGSNFWNSIPALLNFLPLSDSNIIYTFHYYDPFLFTHQGVSWTNPPYLPARTFPLAGEVELLNTLFEAARRWSEIWKVPVNVGEFGVTTAADADSRCRWVEAVMDAVHRQGFSYIYWDAIHPYDAFGFFEEGRVEQNACIPCFRTALRLYPSVSSTVELPSLQAQCAGKGVLLWWNSSNFLRFNKVSLQRSYDEQKWFNIWTGEQHQAYGTDIYYYDEPDQYPVFYRLYYLSPSETILMSSARLHDCSFSTEIQVSLIPAQNVLRVQSTVLCWTSLQLADNQGILRLSRVYQSPINRTDLAVHHLEPGLYLLSILTTDGKILHRKIAIVR